MPRPSEAVVSVRGLEPLGSGREGASFFILRLARPAWAGWRPGQFVMVRPFSFGLEIPWGRPFGICDMSEDELICFFRACGRGTARMARLCKGEQVRVWGPLGNGFAVDEKRPALLLAGGMGLAPFVGYALRHPAPERLSMLFGHRDPEQCFPLGLISGHIGLECMREQGPGDLERFIGRLGERMAQCATAGGIALACGPLPFLRSVQKFSADLGLPAQLSLENRMACGVGACLGCVTKTSGKWPVEASRSGYVQVCSNGPVFWADQIEL